MKILMRRLVTSRLIWIYTACTGIWFWSEGMKGSSFISVNVWLNAKFLSKSILESRRLWRSIRVFMGLMVKSLIRVKRLVARHHTYSVTRSVVYPNYWDSQDGLNSVDPDQTPQIMAVKLHRGWRDVVYTLHARGLSALFRHFSR